MNLPAENEESKEKLLISEITREQDEKKTKINFFMRQVTDYNVVEQSNPPVLVLDIAHSVIHESINNIEFSDDGIVRNIEAIQKQDTARFIINLRETTPYNVEIRENKLMIVLDNPDTRNHLYSDKAEIQRKNIRTIYRDLKKSHNKENEQVPAEAFVSDNQNKNLNELDKKEYFGHPIAFDFQDADIRSVLRLMANEAGYNLVIDSQVKGSVNLLITKPIPWDQAFDVLLKTNQLEMIMEGTIIRVSTQENFYKEQEARKKSMIAKREAKAEKIKLRTLTTEIIPINYTTADSLLPILQPILSQSKDLAEVPSIMTDKRTNILIVKDLPEAIEKIKEIIALLDKRTPQVTIEARIVTTSKAFGKQFGIQWGGRYSKSDTGYTFPHTVDVIGDTLDGYLVNLPPSGALGQIGVSLGHIDKTKSLDIQLSAMESSGKGKVISNPRIATMDNESASITSGVKLPYLSVDADGKANVTFQNASISLNVTPHITPNNCILLEIKAEKSSPDWGNAVAGQPAIAQNSVQTKYFVENGETAVIGGLMEETDSLDTDKVPWFCHIPIIGLLFRNKKTSKDHNELLIFITPRIIDAHS